MSHKELLDYCLHWGLKPLSQFDSDHSHESIFSLGELAKLKVTHFYGQKQAKLSFYGLYQYEGKGTPKNALKLALRIIRALLKFVNRYNAIIQNPKYPLTLSIAHVDICYDFPYPIDKALNLDELMSYLSEHYHKPKLFQDDKVLTGIEAGNKNTRFKYVIYDKAYKNNLQINLTRFEKRFKEKARKPVPIVNETDLYTYLRQCKNEFATELLEIEKCLSVPLPTMKALLENE